MSVTPSSNCVLDSGAYHRYLSSVVAATKAKAASVFIAEADSPGKATLLLQSGSIDLIPEHASEETAAASARCANAADAALLQSFPSSSATAVLLRVATDTQPDARAGSQHNISRRRSLDGRSSKVSCVYVWLGLAFETDFAAREFDDLFIASSSAPKDERGWIVHSLLMAATAIKDLHANRSLLSDPTSQLPGRAEFQIRLKSAFSAARNHRQTLGLLMINPDNFGAINERLGQESGDRALVAIANTLRKTLRRDEQIFRYGGAVFSVIVPAADADSLKHLAGKILTSLTGPYLEGAVRLTFSIGGAVYGDDCAEDEQLDEPGLLRLADRALNQAKRSGGGCSVLGCSALCDGSVVSQDRLSGIFTADSEKDYRNMLLLWDTVAVLSASTQKAEIVREFIDRIQASLKPGRVALVEMSETGALDVAAVAPSTGNERAPAFHLKQAQESLLYQVNRTLKAATGDCEDDGNQFESSGAELAGSALRYCVIPVPIDGRCAACLILEGPAATFRPDSSDLIFLSALSSQLGLALDRIELAERVQHETEVESRRLREEVRGLRKSLQSSRLVYTSQQMQSVLDTVRAVASTDVTILIDGESGTGKEMLARAVHEASDRRDQPLVVVDCGAIAHSLIEAELFGYVKGAYTGADRNSPGRIAEADGGTLFLDEIGELPIDVQAKLLRFVQEKEVSQVGSNSTRRVNTRIVAATNRDLAVEATAGRFREDLYYRLKVVTLTAPALRERPADVLPLARHFLEKFSLQYEKPVRRFRQDAEQLLERYSWPGNVRELQNCVLRAVILCEDESLGASLLQVDEPASSYSSSPQRGERPEPIVAEDGPPSAPCMTNDPWLLFRQTVAAELERILRDTPQNLPPIGGWVAEDFIRAANENSHSNARQGAGLLGIPETTYRRQLKRIRTAESLGTLIRPAHWSQMLTVVRMLVPTEVADGQKNLIETAKQLLLEEVLAKNLDNDSGCAALMDVTVPTYRRWVEKLQMRATSPGLAPAHFGAYPLEADTMSHANHNVARGRETVHFAATDPTTFAEMDVSDDGYRIRKIAAAS